MGLTAACAYGKWRIDSHLTEGAILRQGEFVRSPLWEAMLCAPPRVSPDGCWIACSNGTQLLVAGAPAGTQRLVGPPYVGRYD